MIVNRASRALASRWVRTRFDPAAFGLVPRAALDPRAAGPETDPSRKAEHQRVADAAFDGEWREPAAYVRAAGSDWDARWSRLELLVAIAGNDDRWLADWRTAEPADGDAATVHASLLLHQAWAVRGSAYARDVPEENMRRFRAGLPASMAAAQRAAELAPEDPGPWAVMITVARALSYSHSEFADLWRNLVRRAPHHTGAHWQALQFWCAKWHGSDQLMIEFAERAVASAPPGSLLPGVYLHALDELRTKGALRSARHRAVLADVAARLDAVAPDREGLARLRHLLAHRLGEAGLYEAALDRFRQIGPYCGAEPWTSDPAGPEAAFDHARGLAAHGARKNATS
ncbi:hypothetical protein [Streptomyces sp. RerS4]|uniref:hypothetical protein n=1 Tax=Streptomyces sp. RerS4 TaxID=2942449 RepID=UPI00201C3CC0|nr:hypothetical protein [Streptomyces sp. RerS4]UQX02694.1 hypothetical protein M4D82_21030 [Streptomyces sp. RerS4]